MLSRRLGFAALLVLVPSLALAQKKAEPGWFAFAPKVDPAAPSPIDLRRLNEKFAGEHGFIGAKDGHFLRTGDGQPVRFWAVNGPSSGSKSRADLEREARLLARYGVNLVRIHHGYFDPKGEPKPDEVARAIDIVETMKAEGIYSHFSVYFPVWFNPPADTAWLDGYDGKTHPFAALFFNADFQKKYRMWWKALLHTPSPKTGKRLVDDPAVMGLEIQNEDSLFFWTFNLDRIPDAESRILEKQFGDWLAKKYGSLEVAMKAWNGQKTPRDKPDEGRMSFRPLWNMFNERSPRDRDAARFLTEVQRNFYLETIAYLKNDLGFKGVVTASNWVTASPQILGPLEHYSYAVGDFVDRHAYFGCRAKGEGSEWSVREGHTYLDRTVYRFDSEDPKKPRTFAHPAMDIHVDDKPSMISEIAWNRPNKYRSEAPIYLSTYGALHDSDAIVHFAMDGARWTTKPGFWMQPWTLMSPANIGQFPAAALIYRNGLVKTGDLLADIELKIDDILDLKGSPLPQHSSFDDFRLKDVPEGKELKPGQLIDPLVHYVGRTRMRFTKTGSPAKMPDLSKLVDRKAQTVRSSTGELTLDFGNGMLRIDAPQVQGVSGQLTGSVELKDVAIKSSLSPGHILVVSLDGQPLDRSREILVQAMSEEKNSGFKTEDVPGGGKRITKLGRDPWLVRELDGRIMFKRPDAGSLKVTALDHNGAPGPEVGRADSFPLRPDTMYYLIRP